MTLSSTYMTEAYRLTAYTHAHRQGFVCIAKYHYTARTKADIHL